MNQSIRHASWLLVCVATALLVYVALLTSPVTFGLTILFYRGCALALVAAAVAGVTGAVVTRRTGTPFLALPAALTTLSASLCFLIVYPVTIDRSISVYLLAAIDAAPGQLDRVALEQRFVADYVGSMRAIDRRIAEQVASGNVRVAADGRLALTPQGTRFVAVSRRAARLFGTDVRFVDHIGDARRAAP